jgi:hypothetical protein
MNDARRILATTRAAPWLSIIAGVAFTGFLLQGLGAQTFFDPDSYHQMALGRETWRAGALPRDDVFAFTPTIHPSVYHEWAAGAVLYWVAKSGGASGVMALKFLLVAALVAATLGCARRQRVGVAVVALLAPLALVLVQIGLTTLRAGVYTLVFLAVELLVVEADRRGRRSWIAVWLAMMVLWQNLHGAFVIGFLVLALHAVEQGVSRRPYRHLVLALAGAAVLTLVNPYGAAFYPGIWRSLTQDRALVAEWNPLWHGADKATAAVFVFALLVVAYAAMRLGWRRLPGLSVVLAIAAEALLHQRHLPLFAVAWFCQAPAWVQQTPMGAMCGEIWRRRPRVVAAAFAVLGIVAFARAAVAQPWRLRVPASVADGRQYPLTYPVGAARYLRDAHFRGNLVTPFVAGGFISWKLYPNVLVSLDGRYEVAYEPSLVVEHLAFFDAEPGWPAFLARHRADAVLTSRSAKIVDALPGGTVLTRVYRDDLYEIWARADLHLPPADSPPRVDPDRFP